MSRTFKFISSPPFVQAVPERSITEHSCVECGEFLVDPWVSRCCTPCACYDDPWTPGF